MMLISGKLFGTWRPSTGPRRRQSVWIRRYDCSGLYSVLFPLLHFSPSYTWPPQVDFERNGQISSDTLHKHLVSALPRNSVLHILFDCCHSGSAVELPYVYRTDENGNINLVDNLKQGVALLGEATNLIQGGLRFDKMRDAEQLYAGATSFFKGLVHQGVGEGADGLQKEDFEEDWVHEGKSVFMVRFLFSFFQYWCVFVLGQRASRTAAHALGQGSISPRCLFSSSEQLLISGDEQFSGCKDDQTSADAFIQGKHVGKTIGLPFLFQN